MFLRSSVFVFSFLFLKCGCVSGLHKIRDRCVLQIESYYDILHFLLYNRLSFIKTNQQNN